MAGYRARTQPEPEAPHKAFSLPSTLDMGQLKLEDLEFDLDREVARLRAEDSIDSDAHLPELRREGVQSL